MPRSRRKSSSRSRNSRSRSTPRHPPQRSSPAGGFTLVEVLIAGAITAVLATALMYLFAGAIDLSRTVHARDQLRRDAARAAGLLHADISQAERILSAGSNGLLLETTAGDTITYYAFPKLAPDTLGRQINSGAPAVVATGVDTAQFAFHAISRPYVRELLGEVVQESIVGKYDEGDWDAWVAMTHCELESRDNRKIEDRSWAGEEIWPDETFDAATRVAFRVWAKDKYPPEVDLLVRLHEANHFYPEYPGDLLAEGVLDRFELTESPAWHEVTLTTLDSRPIQAGGHYWLAFRPVTTGGHTYAGHVEYERIKDCYENQWPMNDLCYRETGDAGDKWSDASYRKEAFFFLWGMQKSVRLTEVTETIADTIGVSYRLALRDGEEHEHRVGFVALHDL